MIKRTYTFRSKEIEINTYVDNKGIYRLFDIKDKMLSEIKGCVPKVMNLTDDPDNFFNIILNIDKNGIINGWNKHANLDEFEFFEPLI